MTSMNDVDLDAGKVQVAVFTQTDAALAELRERYNPDTLPDPNTSEGYEFVRAGAKELTSYRTKLDKERQRIKAPYLEAGRIIDAEAKRITGELRQLEEPIKAAKKEVDDREKREKEARLARLAEKVNAIRDYPSRARGQSSCDIAELIEECDGIDTQNDFYEATNEAVKAQREALDTLGEMYADRLQFEQAENARMEAERQAEAEREAQAIQARINEIAMAPSTYIGKPASTIRQGIEDMESSFPATAQYGDRAHEAEKAHKQAIEQLRALLSQAEAQESTEAERKAQEEAEANIKARQEAEGRLADDQLARDVQESAAPAIPPEDMADVGDLVESHEQEAARYYEACDDIAEVLGLGRSEDAEAVVDAILAGEVRHVGFSAE